MEAIGRLAGGVAHDFNNLLTVIKSYAQIALFQLGPEDELRADVEAIDGAADRAAALTRQLLAFSRRQVLEPELVDLRDVVVDTEKMLRRLIGEHVALRTALDPCAGAVLADRNQIEQVLVNLAVNARDAMPAGGVLTLRIDAVRLQDAAGADLDTPVQAGPYVRLTVEDTGEGMDAETLAHIFEPFFTTKADGKGTGLGLSTVYGIVRQSGGFVRVASASGRGTRFEVHLPRAEGAPCAWSLEEGPPGDGDETILVVEDEEAVRALVRRTLVARGYTVHDAASGHDALALHAALPAPVDLLLTDVVMPGLSGKALADALVARRPGLRVLYMSGYTEDEVVDRGVLRAGVRLLDKPFSSDALARAVRAALDCPPSDAR
jgi:CheY-like chemotaxis protein